MDETKRSRCCSLRSAWTKKISDIKLSDNGNCAACLVLICYGLFSKFLLICKFIFICCYLVIVQSLLIGEC